MDTVRFVMAQGLKIHSIVKFNNYKRFFCPQKLNGSDIKSCIYLETFTIFKFVVIICAKYDEQNLELVEKYLYTSGKV